MPPSPQHVNSAPHIPLPIRTHTKLLLVSLAVSFQRHEWKEMPLGLVMITKGGFGVRVHLKMAPLRRPPVRDWEGVFFCQSGTASAGLSTDGLHRT